MAFAVEDICVGISEECGCYEETCLIFPYEAILHLEGDGTGDAFLDCGDYEIEKNFPANTIEELRVRTIEFLQEYHA